MPGARRVDNIYEPSNIGKCKDPFYHYWNWMSKYKIKSDQIKVVAQRHSSFALSSHSLFLSKPDSWNLGCFLSASLAQSYTACNRPIATGHSVSVMMCHAFVWKVQMKQSDEYSIRARWQWGVGLLQYIICSDTRLESHAVFI